MNSSESEVDVDHRTGKSTPAWAGEPWRLEIVSRLDAAMVADVDPRVWEWLATRASVPPKRRAAYLAAGERFTKSAADARALAAELGAHKASSDYVRRLSLELHESLREALGEANVGDVPIPRDHEDSDPHIVLVVRWMGLDLGDLLPPLAQEPRGSVSDQKRVDAKGMVQRLGEEFLQTPAWSSDGAKFEKLGDNLGRVAQTYQNSLGPKPAANRPRHGNRLELIRLAGEQGIKPSGLAKMLARLGMLTSAADVLDRPRPMAVNAAGRPKYRTEADFVAAHEKWVSLLTRKHFDRLRQVGRQKKVKVGK